MEIGDKVNTNKIVDKSLIYLDSETKKFKEGNPGGGRPKGTLSITNEIKKRLRETKTKDKKLLLDKLIDNILDSALKKKDINMIKQIWNYVDGMPTQKTELEGNTDMVFFIRSKEEVKKIEDQNAERD